MITLLASTNQEAFDKVAAHLKALPEQSREETGFRCAYSHKRGGCAIGGPLLTAEDAEILDGYEYPGINTLIRSGVVAAGGLSQTFLAELQRVHDYTVNWSDNGFIGHKELRAAGARIGLDVSAV